MVGYTDGTFTGAKAMQIPADMKNGGYTVTAEEIEPGRICAYLEYADGSSCSLDWARHEGTIEGLDGCERKIPVRILDWIEREVWDHFYGE